MKNLLIALAFILALGYTAEAQKTQTYYKVGESNLNIGVGLGSTLVGDLDLPPISASYEVGSDLFKIPNVSLGGYVGFAQSSEEYFAWKWSYTHIILGARGSYHFYADKMWDCYGGLMIGYNIVSSSVDGPGDDYAFSAASSGMTYSLHLGARYFISNSFGLYAELGYGVAYLNFGATFSM